MNDDLTRRDFHRLSVAAFGGVVAGAALTGCGDGEGKDNTKKKDKDGDGGKDKDKSTQNVLLQEPHVCRGLNTCKGEGKGGDNECAGQGTCATAMEITCSGNNDCKGRGGCQGSAGVNECKGEGGCHVPLQNEDEWKKVRAKFEEAYKEKHDKAPGDPPPKG